METQRVINETSFNRYARIAGALLLMSILAGIFGEIAVTSRLVVPGDAHATAQNIHESLFLYRLGFAAYLIEAICDVSLALIFYQLLKSVRKDFSLLAAFFALMATATFAFAELFYIIAPVISEGNFTTSFSQIQLNDAAMFSLKIYGYAGGVFMVFYGMASIIRGYLIYKASYIPKYLGILYIIGGACFILRNFLLVLIPSFATDILLLPMLIAMLSIGA